MAISSGDKALLRHPRQRIGGGRNGDGPIVNAVPLRPVALARINQVNFTYPLAQITVDNTIGWSAVKTGMAFAIGTASQTADITWGVVRKAPTSTILYIDARGRGDPAFARAIHADLADNQYVTIYKHRPPWGLLSRISNGVFLKKYDLAYTDEGSNPDPFAQFGGWRQAFVDDDTGLATFTFDAARAVDSSGKQRAAFAWGAKTITGYQWFGDGGAVVSGSLTSSSVTLAFEAGFYVVELTVLDSASKTHNAFRYVWANARSGAYEPFNTRFVCSLGNDTQDNVGRSLNLMVYGDTTEYDLYPGQGFLITEPAAFGVTNGGADLTDGDARVHSFVGYTPERLITRTRRMKSVEVKIESPAIYAKRLPQVTQQMSEVDDGDDENWTQVTSVLSHPPGAVWYQLNHHAPQLLQAHDFLFKTSLKNLRKQNFVWQQTGGIGQTFDMVAELMLGNIGSRSDGSLVLAQYGAFMEDADRDALETKFDWQAGDTNGELSYPEEQTPRVGQARAHSFAFSGGSEPRAYGAVAPDDAQGQGAGRAEVAFIVPPSTDTAEQTRTQQVAGHKFALENPLTPEFGFAAKGNIDIAEPCDVDVWHGLSIDSAYSPPAGSRMIPLRVTRSWARRTTSTGSHLSKSIRIDWRLETKGKPGRKLKLERGGASVWVPGGFNVSAPAAPTPPVPPGDAFWLPSGTGKVAGFCTNNYAIITSNWSGIPLWALVNLVSLGLSGDLQDFVPEPIFPYNTAKKVNGWILTSTGIYRVLDVFGAMTLTLQKTFISGSVVGRIQTERTTPGWVMVYRYVHQGVAKVYYTTDFGTNWNASSGVPTGYASGATTDHLPALWMSPVTPGLARINAFTDIAAVNPTPASYQSSNYGALFSSLSNPNLNPTGRLGMNINGPYQNQNVQYITKGIFSVNYTHQFLKVNGLTQTNVSPTYLGNEYAPSGWGLREHAIADSNSNKAVMIGRYTNANEVVGVWKTAAAWASNTLVFTPDSGNAGLYRGCAIGSDGLATYLWGAGRIFYSPDFLSTVIDKTGDIPDSSFDIVNICGAA